MATLRSAFGMFSLDDSDRIVGSYIKRSDLPSILRIPDSELSKLIEKEIYVPELSIQRSIVGRIDNEKKLVDANRELIAIYEQKIKDRIDRLWN